MRKVQFVNGEYYHIYNRGIDKKEIFKNIEDYSKFYRGLKEFNNVSYYEQRLASFRQKELSSFLTRAERVVEIIAYSLNPNHFHMILKQIKENGIPNFMHKIGTSTTNHFNKKYKRSGSLFQGPYKAIHIDSNDYLLWLSGYVNGNIEIHRLGKAEAYRWSSYKRFLEIEEDDVLGDISIILSQRGESEGYKKFTEVVIQESGHKKEMEKYLLGELEDLQGA